MRGRLAITVVLPTEPAEKAKVHAAIGFVDLEHAATLTRYSGYPYDVVEQSVEGHDRGDYVAIGARRPLPYHGLTNAASGRWCVVSEEVQ